MALPDEEDFELVLGNRQLFFLAVVLFGLFFSIGYTVGYSRGRNSADAVVAATREPSPPAAEATPPSSTAPVNASAEEGAAEEGAKNEPASSSAHETAASLKPDTKAADAGVNGSQRETQSAAASQTEASRKEAPATESHAKESTAKESTARHEPARESASSAQRLSTEAASARPKAETPASRSGTVIAQNTPPKTPHIEPARPGAKPAGSAPPPGAGISGLPTVSVADIAPGTIYLQVAASRDAAPARKSLLELQAKGHPVALDNDGGEWYRILVGPFSTREEADAYMARLKTEGINSFLRKF